MTRGDSLEYFIDHTSYVEDGDFNGLVQIQIIDGRSKTCLAYLSREQYNHLINSISKRKNLALLEWNGKKSELEKIAKQFPEIFISDEEFASLGITKKSKAEKPKSYESFQEYNPTFS